MTEENLNLKIQELIKKRKLLHNDIDAQNEINKKLTKLYEIRYIVMQQKLEKSAVRV